MLQLVANLFGLFVGFSQFRLQAAALILGSVQLEMHTLHRLGHAPYLVVRPLAFRRRLRIFLFELLNLSALGLDGRVQLIGLLPERFIGSRQFCLQLISQRLEFGDLVLQIGDPRGLLAHLLGVGRQIGSRLFQLRLQGGILRREVVLLLLGAGQLHNVLALSNLSISWLWWRGPIPSTLKSLFFLSLRCRYCCLRRRLFCRRCCSRRRLVRSGITFMLSDLGLHRHDFLLQFADLILLGLELLFELAI
mmetsp:Transcript_52016/g.86682  ORF Transcript_52016/g.86682 Transcript_52016/m.86682 type:complete len:249 (-) Transcript_52016:533-1279(-)